MQVIALLWFATDGHGNPQYYPAQPPLYANEVPEVIFDDFGTSSGVFTSGNSVGGGNGAYSGQGTNGAYGGQGANAAFVGQGGNGGGSGFNGNLNIANTRPKPGIEEIQALWEQFLPHLPWLRVRTWFSQCALQK